jgi:hypothetical protein
MIAPAECEFNLVAVADAPETQTQTPATAKEESDIIRPGPVFGLSSD